MRIKNLAIVLIISVIISCKGKEETPPAYVNIDAINFKYENVSTVGNGGTAITDAWVYNNDELLGVFELPTTIAIAAQGTHNITVRGGIKLNGISATREAFSFYEPWNSTIELAPLDTAFINPTVRYYPETGISFIENFEDVILKYDTTSLSTVALERTKISSAPNYIENYVGKATLTSSNSIFSAYTKALFSVPTASTLPIYLELDYMCNQDFSVHALISEPGSAITDIKLLTLRSTVVDGEMEWKHIYIDLTDYFIGRESALGFGLAYSALYHSGNSEGFIYLDNTKVVNTP